MSSFDDAFAALIGNEGGYSNNIVDPGGETMWGVTKVVAMANGYQGDMHALSLAQAKQIAKSQYWDKYQCDQYDAHVSFQVFDSAYNGGHSAQWLQQAAGVTPDGVIGPITIKAVNSVDPLKIILRFDGFRLQYLGNLPTWPTFGHGWVNRISNNMVKGAA